MPLSGPIQLISKDLSEPIPNFNFKLSYQLKLSQELSNYIETDSLLYHMKAQWGAMSKSQLQFLSSGPGPRHQCHGTLTDDMLNSMVLYR